MRINRLSNNAKATIKAYQLGYKILSDGKIYSPFNGIIKGDIKGGINRPNYVRLSIIKKCRSRVFAHRLVAFQKYGIDMFRAGIVVRHKNGNSLDNSHGNILIGTHSDNMNDIPKKIRIRSAITASNKIRKFSDEDVSRIKKDRHSGMTYKELMEKYSISSKGTMSYIINNNYVTEKT